MATSQKSCESCKHFHPSSDKQMCHRYPVRVEISLPYVCGEHRVDLEPFMDAITGRMFDIIKDAEAQERKLNNGD